MLLTATDESKWQNHNFSDWGKNASKNQKGTLRVHSCTMVKHCILPYWTGGIQNSCIDLPDYPDSLKYKVFLGSCFSPPQNVMEKYYSFYVIMTAANKWPLFRGGIKSS